MAEQGGIGVAVVLARAFHLRQHRARHTQRAQQVVIPLERVDVEEQRATGVAHVGDVRAAAGEPPDQERVDRAEEHIAPLGPGAQAGDRVEHVFELGAGEVWIEHQPGFLPEHRLETSGLQRLADRRTDAALPDDRVCHRLARDAVPHDRRLALVGDADRGDVCGRQPRLGESLARDSQLRRPDRFGIVLDLAGLRKDLFELLLRDRHDRAVPPEDNRAAGGRSLIEREHETAHDSATCWSVPAEVRPGGGVTGASGGW